MSATQKQLALYKARGLDITVYDKLRQDAREIEERIERVRDEYQA